MGWPAVQGFQNGQSVEASVLNNPISQLAERTEHLLRLINANDRTMVCIDATLKSDTSVTYRPGQPVYRLPDGTFALASAEAKQEEWFYASEKAMAVGVLSALGGTGGTATVVLYGHIDFTKTLGAANLPLAADLIADEKPASGRHYLSVTAGKLTKEPSGPVIYVCDVNLTADGTHVRSLLVSPQYRDTGESHVHRTYALGGNALGGYALRTAEGAETRLVVTGLLRQGFEYDSMAQAPFDGELAIEPCGAWTGTVSDDTTYIFTITPKESGGYTVAWHTDNGKDAAGSADVSFAAGAVRTDQVTVGKFGLRIVLVKVNGSIPDAKLLEDAEWHLPMPEGGRAWGNHAVDGTLDGFRLNLGFYPEMARFVPPEPANAAAVTIDGVELLSDVFKSEKQWAITGADDEGGPWLVYYGGLVHGDSAVTPFSVQAGSPVTSPRHVALHVNRMRVGPTGFVTSLQVAKGSPLRLVSAQTGADAVQGALLLALDMAFKSTARDVPGAQVVKRINGAEFETGPVVERIIAGPGIGVNRGQGTVTVSATNAVYAGDFETIALKNAKEDLAGGVFPYTKLLRSDGVKTAFTAKFRVPDHIPYKRYHVIVSASVFGEEALTSQAAATFQLKNYTLEDQACTPDATVQPGGSIAAPTEGAQNQFVSVVFTANTSFDPVLVHGFPVAQVPDVGLHRQHVDALLLKTNEFAIDGTYKPLEVKPGWFVGLEIERTAGGGSDYAPPIGFMSLRWNLVEVEEVTT